ncbi:MAG: hypothetical protein HC805_04045 [Alkalinema sp. RL_2_19]|nr:hypothetical protein [Alkalinema sp. RL_2_19]
MQFLRPSVAHDDAKQAGEALKIARDYVTLLHARSVAQAQPIDEAKAKQLSEKTEALTLEETLSLTRWQLSHFYRLEDVTAEDVLFDKKGTTQQQIRNLEAALSHAKAIEHSAKSITQNVETPQDWSRSAVRRWLLEQAGMTTLIAQIVAGEVDELTPELTQSIAQFVRQHATEFRMGFGFSKIDAMSNQQIIGILLSTCDIKTKRHRRRGTYSIDQVHLALLLAVLQRRQPADPHPREEEDRSGVWIGTKSPVNVTVETVPAIVPGVETAQFKGALVDPDWQGASRTA